MSELISFDTKQHEASKQLAAWRHALREVFFQVDVADIAGGAINGFVAKRKFGSVQLSTITSTRCRVVRNRQAIAADKIERFSAVFPTRGSFEWRTNSVTTKNEVGTFFVMNSGEEYEVDHSDDASMISMSAPCEVLRERIRHIDDMHSKAFSAGSMSASITRHFVESAIASGIVAENQRVEALCFSMLDLLLQRR